MYTIFRNADIKYRIRNSHLYLFTIKTILKLFEIWITLYKLWHRDIIKINHKVKNESK